jgi:hypothetical protein
VLFLLDLDTWLTGGFRSRRLVADGRLTASAVSVAVVLSLLDPDTWLTGGLRSRRLVVDSRLTASAVSMAGCVSPRMAAW